jgi:hypothetical protein
MVLSWFVEYQVAFWVVFEVCRVLCCFDTNKSIGITFVTESSKMTSHR